MTGEYKCVDCGWTFFREGFCPKCGGFGQLLYHGFYQIVEEK